MKQFLLLTLLISGANAAQMHIVGQQQTFHPLDRVKLADAPGQTIVIYDGQGHEYFRGQTTDLTLGGALGTQKIVALDSDKPAATITIQLTAETSLQEDTGKFQDLLSICRRTMEADGVGTIQWRGRTYHYFDPWILDHSHTTKGMQYFSPYAAEMVDLFGAAQKSNGMIWSFAFPDHAPEHQYHYWAYKDQGYAWADDNVLFARQPVENHNEANFVDALFLSWQANGDDNWMRSHLQQAEHALDYSVTDPARWSPQYGLLKKGYTIDSWDFQPDDKYLVHFPMGSEQQIDPQRTKFTIFFGDNTNYAHACDELATMLEHAGDKEAARKYRERAQSIREHLDRVAWNGTFYTHHIELDPTVHRDIGVPESEQFAMSNAYALNRGVTQRQREAIIRSYQKLKSNLPPGSPGEWYAVYPPYTAGFGQEDSKWQYMNGGVQPHAAGELARGALEHGFEAYGADILARLRDLGAAHDRKLYFAYTGAFPPPPPAPQFQTVDLSASVNMALTGETAKLRPWMDHTGPNDMRNLPTGRQSFATVPFEVSGGVAVSEVGSHLPRSIDIPVQRAAAAIYLLHSAEHIGSAAIAGVVRFSYSGGGSESVYILRGKHIGSTWFPSLDSKDGGIAWRGANSAVGDVGVYWAAIANPHPDETIDHITIEASQDGSTYALLGLTTADRMPWHKAGPVSYGGPDNWSAALVTYALIQGLAGVQDDSQRFQDVTLSPRWLAAGVKTARATVRYAASNGYISYDYAQQNGEFDITATGNAGHARIRILLPRETTVSSVTINGSDAPFHLETVEQSKYAVTECSLIKPVHIAVRYQ